MISMINGLVILCEAMTTVPDYCLDGAVAGSALWLEL